MKKSSRRLTFAATIAGAAVAAALTACHETVYGPPETPAGETYDPASEVPESVYGPPPEEAAEDADTPVLQWKICMAHLSNSERRSQRNRRRARRKVSHPLRQSLRNRKGRQFLLVSMVRLLLTWKDMTPRKRYQRMSMALP